MRTLDERRALAAASRAAQGLPAVVDDTELPTQLLAIVQRRNEVPR